MNKFIKILLPLLLIGVVSFAIYYITQALKEDQSPEKSEAGVLHNYDEFPKGIYVNVTDSYFGNSTSSQFRKDLKTIRSLGFNFIMFGVKDKPNAFSAANIEKIYTALDWCQENKLQMTIEVFPPVYNETTYPILDALIKKVKTHPAFYGYSLIDEPSSSDQSVVSPTKVRKLNDFIKTRDNNHPTLMALNAGYSFVNAQKYMGIADIESFDVYAYFEDPVLTDEAIAFYYDSLRTFVEKYNNLQNPNTKGHFVILPSFTGKIIDGTTSVPGQRREATYEELRLILHNTFFHTYYNASQQNRILYEGVMYYSWDGSFVKDMDQNAKSLKELPSLQNTISKINQSLSYIVEDKANYITEVQIELQTTTATTTDNSEITETPENQTTTRSSSIKNISNETSTVIATSISNPAYNWTCINADINGDSDLSVLDLALFAKWYGNYCPEDICIRFDTDGDGTIGENDLEKFIGCY